MSNKQVFHERKDLTYLTPWFYIIYSWPVTGTGMEKMTLKLPFFPVLTSLPHVWITNDGGGSKFHLGAHSLHVLDLPWASADCDSCNSRPQNNKLRV